MANRSGESKSRQYRTRMAVRPNHCRKPGQPSSGCWLSTVSILGMAAAAGHHVRIRSGWLTRIPIKKTTKSPSMSAVKRPRWTSAATPS